MKTSSLLCVLFGLVSAGFAAPIYSAKEKFEDQEGVYDAKQPVLTEYTADTQEQLAAAGAAEGSPADKSNEEAALQEGAAIEVAEMIPASAGGVSDKLTVDPASYARDSESVVDSPDAAPGVPDEGSSLILSGLGVAFLLGLRRYMAKWVTA